MVYFYNSIPDRDKMGRYVVTDLKRSYLVTDGKDVASLVGERVERLRRMLKEEDIIFVNGFFILSNIEEIRSKRGRFNG